MKNGILANYTRKILDLHTFRDIPDESGSPFSDDFGYELRDINDNGFPELILGVEEDIEEIYTLKNKKPVKIFEKGYVLM